VRLDWNAASAGSSRVYYRVLRVRGDTDVICRSTGGAANCFFSGRKVATTRATSYAERPGRGTFTYRVGVGTNWLDDPSMGDVFLVSAPVTVKVR
jgi:hypothetical protein